MQPFALNVQVFGVEVLDRQIMRKADHVSDFTPAFRRIAERLRDVAKRQFQTEGEYGSGGWKPLAASTIERKRAAGQPARILVATGELRDSLVGAKSTQRITRHELHWGSKVPYGRYHMTGTRRMPRRQPVNMPDRERREILKEIQRHIVEAGRSGGIGE